MSSHSIDKKDCPCCGSTKGKTIHIEYNPFSGEYEEHIPRWERQYLRNIN